MTAKFEYDRTRALKHRDLKPCIRCGKGVMHNGVPLFSRVTLEAFGVDLHAVERQHGLELMLGGNAVIANAMGPDDDLGLPIGDADSGLLCNSCCCDPDFSLAELAEILTEKERAA